MHDSTDAPPRRNPAAPESTGLTTGARFAIHQDLMLALHVSRLAAWCGRASGVLDAVRLAARIDPDMDAALRSHEILINSAEWGELEVDAMATLLHLQQDRITDAMRTLGRDH